MKLTFQQNTYQDVWLKCCVFWTRNPSYASTKNTMVNTCCMSFLSLSLCIFLLSIASSFSSIQYCILFFFLLSIVSMFRDNRDNRAVIYNLLTFPIMFPFLFSLLHNKRPTAWWVFCRKASFAVYLLCF